VSIGDEREDSWVSAVAWNFGALGSGSRLLCSKTDRPVAVNISTASRVGFEHRCSTVAPSLKLNETSRGSARTVEPVLLFLFSVYPSLQQHSVRLSLLYAMEARSIVSIVGTAVSLGDVVRKCIAGLNFLKTTYDEDEDEDYDDPPQIISTIIDQLSMVQTTLTQHSTWNQPKYSHNPR
jgi:hypothetical protein